MNNTDFMINFLLYVPAIILPLYLAMYSTLHFSFFRAIDRKRNMIRTKVAAAWETKYGGVIGIIDNVHVKYIRVLLPKRVNEDNGFRGFQLAYTVFSVASVILAVLIKSCSKIPAYCNYILFVCVIVFVVLSTVILIMSYNEWKFYRLLDDLDQGT